MINTHLSGKRILKEAGLCFRAESLKMVPFTLCCKIIILNVSKEFGCMQNFLPLTLITMFKSEI